MSVDAQTPVDWSQVAGVTDTKGTFFCVRCMGYGFPPHTPRATAPERCFACWTPADELNAATAQRRLPL